MKNRRQRGFSLIELLVVVAIILVISAIAIPNLLKAKQAGNKAAAVADLRSINSAELIYFNTYGSTYSPNLADMAAPAQSGNSVVPDTSTAAHLLDSAMAQDPGVKSGYTFTYVACGHLTTGCTATAPNNYTVVAAPSGDASNTTEYYIDETGGVTFTTDGTTPTAASAPLS